jgi:hypothetical protein
MGFGTMKVEQRLICICDSSTSIVVSISNGNVSLLGGETEMEVTETWKAHDYEPWIAAFDCWEPNTVWTGSFRFSFIGHSKIAE